MLFNLPRASILFFSKLNSPQGAAVTDNKQHCLHEWHTTFWGFVFHIVKKIFKQTVQGTAWFFLVAYSKMQEKEKLEGRTVLDQKEAGSDDFGNNLWEWQKTLN